MKVVNIIFINFLKMQDLGTLLKWYFLGSPIKIMPRSFFFFFFMGWKCIF